MKKTETQQIISIINQELSHTMFSDYELVNIGIDGTSTSIPTSNKAKEYLQSVILILESAINAIFNAFNLLYHDENEQIIKNVNFLKINSLVNAFENYQRLNSDNKSFYKDSILVKIFEMLFIALKRVEEEHIYNVGSVSEFKKVIQNYKDMYESYTPVPSQPIIPGSPTTIAPKQHEFWITSNNLNSFKEDILQTLPKGTQI